MFCDNCGKSNVSGVKKCRYCGAEMPVKSAGNGFADILTFKGESEEDSAVVTSEAVAPKEEYTYTSRSSIDKETVERVKKLVLQAIIALGISVVLFITSIVFFSCSGSKVNNAEKDDESASSVQSDDKDGNSKGENKTPLNFDSDGDGDPDTNIDKDGDGVPEANIDRNGDGRYDEKDREIERERSKTNTENNPTEKDEENPGSQSLNQLGELGL